MNNKLTEREMNVFKSLINHIGWNPDEILELANSKEPEKQEIAKFASSYIKIAKKINAREEAQIEMNKQYAASELGKIKSKAKAKSSRENGKKGGRPKKMRMM